MFILDSNFSTPVPGSKRASDPQQGIVGIFNQKIVSDYPVCLSLDPGVKKTQDRKTVGLLKNWYLSE